MLFLPNGSLPPKKSKTGIVRGRGPAGHWLRARANVLNTNSPAQQNWRQLFSTAKLNWLSVGPLGQNNTPTEGVNPQDAWSLMADAYAGILQAGLIQGNIQLSPTIIGCANVQAFQVMCQLTMQQLGMGTPGTPALNNAYLGTTSTTQGTTAGSYDVTLTIPNPLPGNPLTWTMGLGVSITGNNTSTWTPTLGAPPAGITATLSAASFSLNYDPITDTSEGGVNITLTATPYAAPISGNLNISVTGPGGTANFDPNLNITTGNLVCVTPPPTFAYPELLSSATVYDLSYTPIGFTLTYNALNVTNYPMQRYNPGSPNTWGPPEYEVPGIFAITASAAYTDSYSPPAASSYKPILFSGPYMPTPAQVLAAWETAYGSLPTSGSIKFQVQYLDPLTGCAGPALSCTAGWTIGTLRSFDRTSWTNGLTGPPPQAPGPIFTFYTALDGTPTVQGANGYGGTITFSPEAADYPLTGTPSKTKSIPAGWTWAFSPATLTLAPGDTAAHAIAITFSWLSTSPCGEYAVHMKATDGISSSGFTATYVANTACVTQTVPNYLSITPTTYNAGLVPGQTTTAVFILFNTGTEDQYVAPIIDNTDPDLTITVDQPNYTVPGGTLTAPGRAVVTVTVTSVNPLTQTTPVLQFEASAGLNTAYSVITFTLLPTGAVTVQPISSTLPVEIPGTTIFTYTVSNETASPATVTLSLTGIPADITATLSTTSVTVPAGTITTPGTATFTITCVVSSGASSLHPAIELHLSSPSNPATATIQFA